MSENKVFRLCENWYIDKDPENKGREMGWDQRISDTAVKAKVPSIIQEALPGCHGVAFYWCTFTPRIEKGESDRLYLYFGTVDYKADAFLNGEYIGSHEGGETPFQFDVTDKVKLEEENLLSVRVVNPIVEDIDGINIVNVPNRNKAPGALAGSCTNHGGVWGEVDLICLPAVSIEDVFLIGDIHTGKLTVQTSIKNTKENEVPVHLFVNVYGRYGLQEKITGSEQEMVVQEKNDQAELSLIVPEVKLWDIDDPNLYTIEVGLESVYGCHKRIERFGFREFLVKDGYFYLNGRKIFLKSSHTGNAFPVGQGYPAIKEQIRKDFIMAKAYGFNMLRAIAGMFRKEQLEVADEIGMMIYEECYASWDLGLGFFLTDGGKDKIGDEEKMLERFDYTTLEMVRRDRNHPSLTIWGLLNEMPGDSPVTRRAKEILPRLRKEDPTRLVLFDSGRWDKYTDIGSGSNPYSNTWDVMMGSDPGGENGEENWFGDMHTYPNYPLNEQYVQFVRTYAKDADKPAFFSETGMSSVFNVIEEAKHYEQYGYRKDLEDYQIVKEQANKLEKDWERLGLKKIYPYAEMMLKESQRISAKDRRSIFDLIRSNPKFNGYSLTGLLDHGWSGEGLWSLWRRFKPEIYDVVCDGWAPLRFCLFAKSHVYRGESFEIEAVLANECVLAPGSYTADFSITGEDGTIEMWSEQFEIEDDTFAVPVMKKTISLDQKTGKYSLSAYMRDASPLGNKLDFYVTDKKELVTDAKVMVCGVEEETVEFLKNCGAEAAAFDGQETGKILVGAKVTEADILALKQAAENGAEVWFINYEAFWGENAGQWKCLDIAADLKLKENWDWLYHKESVLANDKLFKGLGYGLLDQYRFGQVVTNKCFETDMVPDEVICPAFYTGYHGYPGAYACVHNALGMNCGKGKIYLMTFDIEKNLKKEPAAGRLLISIVNK